MVCVLRDVLNCCVSWHSHVPELSVTKSEGLFRGLLDLRQVVHRDTSPTFLLK